MQDYNFILWYILEKTNTKADIISRKDQVDTKDDNKKKLTGKRNYIVRGNSKEQYKRAKNPKKVKKEDSQV